MNRRERVGGILTRETSIFRPSQPKGRRLGRGKAATTASRGATTSGKGRHRTSISRVPVGKKERIGKKKGNPEHDTCRRKEGDT